MPRRCAVGCGTWGYWSYQIPVSANHFVPRLDITCIEGGRAGTQHCYSVTVRPSQAENEVCAFSCLCICAFWRDIGCGMVFRAACHGAWFGLEPRGAGFVFVRSRLLRFSFPRVHLHPSTRRATYKTRNGQAKYLPGPAKTTTAVSCTVTVKSLRRRENEMGRRARAATTRTWLLSLHPGGAWLRVLR
jgi:hypothetical protein